MRNPGTIWQNDMNSAVYAESRYLICHNDMNIAVYMRIPGTSYVTMTWTVPCMGIPGTLYVTMIWTVPCMRIPGTLYVTMVWTVPCMRSPGTLYVTMLWIGQCTCGFQAPYMSQWHEQCSVHADSRYHMTTIWTAPRFHITQWWHHNTTQASCLLDSQHYAVSLVARGFTL